MFFFLLTGGIGNVGHLVLVRGWEQETFVSLEELLLLLPFPFPLFLLKSFFLFQRSVAEVEWKKGGKKNVYRVGHKGKVTNL